MAKSIKLKNENYIDSSAIMHNREILKDILNSKTLVYKGEIFKNKNWNDLEIGFYNINTFTGTGGSNYPADNLFGSLIVLGRVQAAIVGGGIYYRQYDGTTWKAWNLLS